MDPTVTAAAIGVTGTVIVGVTGYWASVRNTSKTIELTRTTVDLTRRTVDLTEQGQVTDRYSKAIEQLGSKEIDVRIGGIYALERIARDSERDHPVVMEVLAAFVRDHSPEQWPPPAVHADLTRADLTCANLATANLTDANLTQAKLIKVSLHFARLTAHFADADLTGANLTRADLTGTLWPTYGGVPEGWQKDAASGRLKRADTDSGDARRD